MSHLDDRCKSGLSRVGHSTRPPGIVLRTGQSPPVHYQRKALTKCMFFCSKVLAFLPISPKGRFKIPTVEVLVLLSALPSHPTRSSAPCAKRRQLQGRFQEFLKEEQMHPFTQNEMVRASSSSLLPCEPLRERKEGQKDEVNAFKRHLR